MDRLTTDTPKNNLETALNLFYVKDGQAWVRGGGPRPDYPDVTLYDYTRATIWGLLKCRSELACLTDDDIQEIMQAWLLDCNNSIEGLIATLYTAAWAFAELRERLKKYEDLEMHPDSIEQQLTNFSSFLMEMTGGRMSKTNYTVQAMVDEAYDYRQKELEEAEQKAYDLGVDSVLRNHFDIPWDEAADLRKNIDHLRELIKAEQEGRLVIMPPPAKEGDPKPSCFFNDNGSLWCNGMAPVDGDEPSERCKQCWYCEFGYAALAEDTDVPTKEGK